VRQAGERYDVIGVGYRRHRRPDPRVTAQITAALGDARRVIDVGAGTGSYGPADRDVIAVEPSRVMIEQRPPGAPRVVQGVAEMLPFPDCSFDAALAVFTIHHWVDLEQGLRELQRVAARQVVLTFDPTYERRLWLVSEYLPEASAIDAGVPSPADIADRLGPATLQVVPVPHDCIDGFFAAYWRRPEQYLDPEVRACISGLARLPPDVIERGTSALRADLESGAWHERHADLLDRDEMDYGYRLVIAG
jgi:SAM-dependent methyltransferase